MSKADIHRVPESLDLGGLLGQYEWSGGVTIVVQGAMRAPIGPNHQVSLEASWRADIFDPSRPRARRPLFTLVAETPAKLFSDLAALTTDGEVKITR